MQKQTLEIIGFLGMVLIVIAFVSYSSVAEGEGDLGSGDIGDKDKLPPGLIAELEGNWTFEIVKQDELGATIEQINQTAFRVIPYSVDSKVTDAVGYEWKMTTNYTSPSTKNEVINTLVSNQPKAELGKGYEINLPSEEINHFRISLGESSTIIDANTIFGQASRYGENENICMNSSGGFHVAYKGPDSDLWYGNSNDRGLTWNTKELEANSITRAGINCYSNDTISVYYSDTDNVIANAVSLFISANSGASFTKRVLASFSGTFNNDISCNIDSNNVQHCCMIDTNDDLWYVNTSNIGFEIEISSADSDHCDIEVNSTDAVHIIISESATDDLDIMFGPAFSTRLSIDDSLGTVSANDGQSISLTIDDNDDYHVAGIFTNDLQYCKGTDLITWNCQELDSSPSYSPDIIVTNNSDIFIFYQENTVDSDADFSVANSSDGTNWDTVSNANDEASHPSMAQSTFPLWARVNNTIDYVFGNKTGFYYNNFTVYEILAPSVDTCTPPVDDESWNWEVTCSDNCKVSSTTYLAGNLSLTGAGYFFVDAPLIFNNSPNQHVYGSGGCQLVYNTGGEVIG